MTHPVTQVVSRFGQLVRQVAAGIYAEIKRCVPEAMDIGRETQDTLDAYGAKPGQASFANNCLLARRLVEQGVRYVQLFDWGWDFHGTSANEDIRDGLTKKCKTVDQPIAALDNVQVTIMTIAKVFLR